MTITIGNPLIALFTRRLDVLPGDVNDDGVVNVQDMVSSATRCSAFWGPCRRSSATSTATARWTSIDYTAVRKLHRHALVSMTQAVIACDRTIMHNDVIVLLSGNRVAFRPQKSLRYSPNRHMLVLKEPRRVKTMRSSNQASGIWPAIVLERLMPEGGRGVFGVIAVALAAIVGGAVPCFAGGLVIEAPNLTATPGSSGSFDLLLMNTNPTGGASFDVSSDQFVLSLSGPLGITFTGVSIATDPVAAPYIFVSSGTTQPGGPPLSRTPSRTPRSRGSTPSSRVRVTEQ